MAAKCNKVVQRKLKTIRDLKHYLKINGSANHVIHDSETDWWWFADNRNQLLEEVFNAGSPLALAPKASSNGGASRKIKSDFNTRIQHRFFLLKPGFYK